MLRKQKCSTEEKLIWHIQWGTWQQEFNTSDYEDQQIIYAAPNFSPSSNDLNIPPSSNDLIYSSRCGELMDD
jgi:hypothetical protein